MEKYQIFLILKGLFLYYYFSTNFDYFILDSINLAIYSSILKQQIFSQQNYQKIKRFKNLIFFSNFYF